MVIRGQEPVLIDTTQPVSRESWLSMVFELVDPKGKDGKRKVDVKVGISNGAKTEIVSNNLKKDEEVVLQ